MLLAIVGVCGVTVSGDETEKFIAEIIHGARSDSERSTKLMEAVAMTEGNQKLQIALLEKSVEYGVKGLRTASDCARVQKAASLLASRDPEKKSFWLCQQAKVYRRLIILSKSKEDKAKIAEKAIYLYVQAGHAAAKIGDWKQSLLAYNDARSMAVVYKQPVRNNLMSRIRTITNLAKAQGQTEKLIESLKTKPDDAGDRDDLVKTFLVTLDDPINASKYINGDVDQKYQAYVPLAAKSVSELELDACKNLSEWYEKELAKTVIPLNKYNMLKRARAYQARALTLYDKSDITSAAMKHRLSQMDAELAKLSSVDPMVCVYCFASGKNDCYDCMVKGKSSGKLQCAKCSSTGNMKCASYDGKFAIKCKSCGGKGTISVIVKSYYSGKYRTTRSCKPCSGSGYMHYETRYRRYRYGTCSSCRYTSPKGSAACTDCSGRGGKDACPKCSGAKTLSCTRCP